MNLAKQYNECAGTFSAMHNIGENSNRENRDIFYKRVDFIRPGTRILDLGCGDGLDLEHYKKLGASVYGLDASEELIKIARQRLPGDDIRVGLFESLPYPDNFFDAVLSKYALQTSADLEPCFREIDRVLKPNGTQWANRNSFGVHYCFGGGPRCRGDKKHGRNRGSPREYYWNCEQRILQQDYF